RSQTVTGCPGRFYGQRRAWTPAPEKDRRPYRQSAAIPERGSVTREGRRVFTPPAPGRIIWREPMQTGGPFRRHEVAKRKRAGRRKRRTREHVIADLSVMQGRLDYHA